MAVSIVGIRLSVSGDAQVKGALAGAEKSLAGVQSAAADATQSLRNLAGAFAGAVTVGAFVKAADSVTILNNQLKLATGSADSAATAYASLFDIAQRSRVSFTELGGTFATISRAAESLKLSQSALLGVTEAIGNAMTISGGSAESMKAALVQLGQGLASGTLRGEELNSILEQTPRLAKALADGLGVPIGALRKLGEEGKLSAEAVITALRSQQSALAAEVAQSATTVGQALQQLQNAVTVAVGDFDKASGSTGAMATGVQAVATTIGELRRAFNGLEESKTDFTAFGEGVGAVMRTMTLGLTTTLTGIRQLGVGAAGLAAAGVALASGNLAGAREAMRAAGEDIDRLGSKWMVQSDAIINSAGSVARATEVNAQAMARMARQGSAATESVKPLDFSKLVGGADKAKKQVDEFAVALSKVTAKDVGLSADYEKTLAALYAGFVKGRIGADAYAAAVESLIKQQPFYIAGVREAADAEKDRIKALDEATKAAAQYYDALQKELGALEANVEKLKLEGEQIGLSKEEMLKLTLARMDDAIATEEQTLAMLALHEAAGEEIKLIERRIALMKQERSLTASNSTKQTTADAAKDAAKEWEKTSDKINDTLTDALMRGFESGKDFAKNMRDTVVNMFKTMVLRPVISAIVNPVAGAITGALGVSGAANAGQSGGIGVGDAFSLVNSLGTGLGSGFGMISGGGLGGWLSASTSLIGTGTAAGSLAGLGALAGPIGAALSVVSLLKGMDDSGTIHTGGLAQYSAAGGTQTSTQHGAFGMGFGGVDYGQAGTALASGMAQTIVGILDTTATAFGKTAGYTAATAFADDTSKDGAWGGLLITNSQGRAEVNWNDTRTSRWAPREFADGEAGAKEYAAAVSRDVRNLLIDQTPYWADAMFNALGDAPTLDQLAATVGQINQVQMALVSMGKASEAFAGMAESATSALLAAMGGAQAATAKLGSYYTNFYTEAERTALATQALKVEMAAFGKEMPATRDAFRSLVDTAIAGGDTKLAANLLNVADKFAAVVPAASDAAEAIAEVAKTAKEIADERASLEKEWLHVTGDTNALRALELADISDSNKALQQQIWAYEDQKAAQEAATQAIEAATASYAESQAAAAAAYSESQQKILDSWADAESFLSGLTRNIRIYLDNLNAEAAGVQGYENAAAAFSAQMTLARGGDRDALSGITSYATTLLDAINRESATSEEARLRAGRVRGQLAGLPAQIKPEQLIVNAINASTQALLSGYSTAIYGVVTSLGQGFDKLDTNLSQGLDFSEFTAAMAGKATDAELQRLFNLIDTDNDNIISKAEAQTAATNTIGQQIKASLAGDFAMLDTSLNGALDMTEFTSAFQGLATDEMLKAIFNELDVNGDGQISKLEAIKASSSETAINTYGLDKLTRIKEMVDSLKWGTPDWDQISTQAMATVAKQQGWTASDISQAIGRFSGQEIADFFAKYGQSISVGGLTAGGAASGSAASLTSGVKQVAGGFVIGGGATSSAASATTSPSVLGNTYYGSLGTAIYDPTAVARLDSINSYVNSLDWTQQGASALETYQAAQQYGVTQAELAIATGYSLADINALFDSAGIPRFASGGVHSGGLRLVGENGPELEVTGPSRIYNAADTARMLSSQGDDEAMAEMVAEIRALREDNRAQARALVQANQRMAKIMERWENNGMPETRVTA